MVYNLQRYITRSLEKEISDSLKSFPATAILGPRQCGKTTLALHIMSSKKNICLLDLEKPSDLRKLEDSEFFLSTQREKLVCIDEVQRMPELFPVLRSEIDQDRRPGRFILLGSASMDLLRQSSESLAGRIHYCELTPFTFNELADNKLKNTFNQNMLWVRGGFPDSILSESSRMSMTWRMDFIRTFLERDISQFGFNVPSLNMHRFWTMLAHYHGQILNASKLGQALNVTHPTIKNYLNILEKTFMVRVLPPFSGNVKKRLIKSPRVYLRDSGILHALLEIDDLESLLGHPVSGASWEGFCIEQILSLLPDWRPCFYRTSSGEEIDLVLSRGTKRLAFEFKASMSPRVSRGFPDTLNLLKPDSAWVVAPVEEPYRLASGATVANLNDVLEELGQCACGAG